MTVRRLLVLLQPVRVKSYPAPLMGKSTLAGACAVCLVWLYDAIPCMLLQARGASAHLQSLLLANSTGAITCECQAAMIPMQEHQSLAEWSEQACFEGPHRSSTMFAAIAKWGLLVWVK